MTSERRSTPPPLPPRPVYTADQPPLCPRSPLTGDDSLNPHMTEGSDQQLPTYEQSVVGGRGRFGRWQGWIEKRAAERLDDRERQREERRREREMRPPTYHQEELSTSPPQASNPFPPALLPHPPTVLQQLEFGSRFIPHSTTQINCVYPLFGDRFLLLGTTTGLSVLVTAPSFAGVAGQHSADPLQDAFAVPIWTGLPVWNMEAIDYHDPSEPGMEGTRTPEGVLLMLVGAGKEMDPNKPGFVDLRAYRLGSIASLARWVGVRQESQPAMVMPGVENVLEKGKDKVKEPKHRPKSSISSIRSLLRPATPARTPSPSENGEWQVVAEDLAHRWASDWISLSHQRQGFAFTCHSDPIDLRRPERGSRTLIALITKTDVHVYSTTTPNGHPHDFTFVKTYYLPSSPRHVAFVQVDGERHRSSLSAHVEDENCFAFVTPSTSSLALYISFGPKACILRLADALVVELDLPVRTSRLDTLGEMVDAVQAKGSSRGRTPSQIVKAAIDGKDEAWGQIHGIEIPALASLPGTMSSSINKRMYAITRGQKTVFLADPITLDNGALVPTASVTWQLAPTRVHIVTPSVDNPALSGNTLQILGLVDDSSQIQEIDTATLLSATSGEQLHVRAARIALRCRSLRAGGRWQTSHPFSHSMPPLAHSTRPALMTRQHSSESDEPSPHRMQLASAGVYVAAFRGNDDWRITWLGPKVGI